MKPKTKLNIKPASLLAIGLIAAVSLGAQAAGYPDKPVKIIVPWSAGGNVDIVTRIVAQALGEELKQPFVVENKPGANGAIGAENAARSAPDGYTLMVAGAETHALNPSLRKSLRYDPLKDFTSIGLVDTFSFSFVVSNKVPVNDLPGFLEYARKNPGKLNFGSWGNGSLSHVAFEQVKQSAGIDLRHIAFKGSAPAMTAVAGGHVEAFIAPHSLAVPFSADGRVKLLAVTSAKRLDNLPKVPTLMEQGVPVELTGWHVWAVPAGTPADVIATLNRGLKAVTARPDVREKLNKANVVPAYATPEEAQKIVDDAHKRWGEVARKAGIKPE